MTKNNILLPSLIQNLSLLSMEIEVPPHHECNSIYIYDHCCILFAHFAFCLHGAIVSFVIKGSDLSIKHTGNSKNTFLICII